MLLRSLICAPLALAALAGGALAGPINPPAGPIAPTYKTLTEVEPRTAISSLPFTINQPGSYYLAGNLSAPMGSNGILITASKVTLDLNGFTLDGATVALAAIQCPNATEITIRNGTLSRWAQGINGAGAHQLRIENVHGVSISGAGITSGFTSVVTNCQVRGGSVGITAADGSIVSGCTVDAAATGFSTGPISSLSDCTAVSCSLDGFDIGFSTTVRGCAARANGGHGYFIAAASQVSQCVAANNGIDGFRMDGAGQLLACTSNGNVEMGVNIFVAGGNPIDAVVEGCNINFNGLHGINQDAGGGSTFRNNTISRNTGAGILVLSSNLIANNRIIENGTAGGVAGVQVNGTANTIQGNNFLNNGLLYFFSAGSSRNLFFGNVCTGGAQVNNGTNTIAPFVSAASAFAGSNLANSSTYVNITY